MKMALKLYLISTLAALILCSPLRAEIIDRVVAAVGDEAITLYDLEKEGALLFGQIRANESESNVDNKLYEARKLVLEKMVEKVLLTREASRAGIKVTEEQVSSTIDNIKKENKLSQEDLVNVLKRDGMDYEGYREDIRGQLLRATIIDRNVRGSIDISDEDVNLYYENNRNEFKEDEEVRVRHIIFTVPKGADREAILRIKGKAEEVFELAEKGDDFAELAKKYSEGPSAPAGGDLGFFKRKDMVKEFADAAFSLKEGEISGPVLSPFGFHIIKMLERRGGALLPFDKAAPLIRARLHNEEMDRGLQIFLEELKSKEEIDILI